VEALGNCPVSPPLKSGPVEACDIKKQTLYKLIAPKSNQGRITPRSPHVEFVNWSNEDVLYNGSRARVL